MSQRLVQVALDDMLRHRTWAGTMYEDELMPKMSDAEYDQWYANSSIVDGVRVGPLTRDYKIKQLLAWNTQLREHMAVCQGELERLLDEEKGVKSN